LEQVIKAESLFDACQNTTMKLLFQNVIVWEYIKQ